ncbi:MAG: aminoacyl-histidine dipeptidase [Bacteroidota bacterium]|nr:aminoacyl-histidine dipeptidase [Bacteroidota bacterium]
MSENIQNLEPKAIWANFVHLNQIPRPSKKETRVVEFVKLFGERLGLETEVDTLGNVLIRKPASPGMEGRKMVILQSHLDMVHQKNNDTVFDFNTEGIKMKIDGDWVHAEGTTLGADNGIGVATILAILESKDIAHPALEALFTIDEETGMTGALGLKPGTLKGRLMLNLDTEDDTELTIGCAGGIDVTASNVYSRIALPGAHSSYQITVKGLAGGHSGMEIHLGRANANKLMNRFLYKIVEDYGVLVHSIDGGGLRNAIPRESVSVVCIPTDKKEAFEKIAHEYNEIFQKEFQTTDPKIGLEIKSIDNPMDVASVNFTKKFIRSVYACPNGIYRMSPDIDRLVQSSNNLARVLLKDGNWSAMCLTRSSVETEKMDLASMIKAGFELCDGKTVFGGAYPGWTPNPHSAIVNLMSTIYNKMYNGNPHVNACHAGLECGILGGPYPDMEMISFGPNIRGAHSPDEKVQISSVQKFWNYLLETLKNIPENN